MEKEIIKMKKKIFFIFLVSIFSSFYLYSQNKSTQAKPYQEDEFNQGLQDLRRFEIITLGSMPFVTMDTAIVYNGYKYITKKADTFNPLATASYNPEEMKKVIITSICISAGIGLTDFLIRIIKRKVNNKHIDLSDAIKIEERQEPYISEDNKEENP